MIHRTRLITSRPRGGATTTTPPQITIQPLSQTVTAGSSVTFSASATGTEPLSYQWKKNGQDIPTATGASFTISAAASSDEADYTVVVSNAAGSATSEKAHLTVV